MLSNEELFASNGALKEQNDKLLNAAKEAFATLRLNVPGQFRFTETVLTRAIKASMEHNEFDSFIHYTEVRASAISRAIAEEDAHVLADQAPQGPQAMSFPDSIFQKINSITTCQKALAA